MAAWKAWEYRIAWSWRGHGDAPGIPLRNIPRRQGAWRPRCRPTSARASVPCPPPARRGRCRSTPRAGIPVLCSSAGPGWLPARLRPGLTIFGTLPRSQASAPALLRTWPAPGHRWPAWWRPRPSRRRCGPCPGRVTPGCRPEGTWRWRRFLSPGQSWWHPRPSPAPRWSWSDQGSVAFATIGLPSGVYVETQWVILGFDPITASPTSTNRETSDESWDKSGLRNPAGLAPAVAACRRWPGYRVLRPTLEC